MAHHQFLAKLTQQRWGVLRWMSLVKKWNSRSEKRLPLQHLFNYEYLYIGGGEAKVTLELPPSSPSLT